MPRLRSTVARLECPALERAAEILIPVRHMSARISPSRSGYVSSATLELLSSAPSSLTSLIVPTTTTRSRSTAPTACTLIPSSASFVRRTTRARYNWQRASISDFHLCCHPERSEGSAFWVVEARKRVPHPSAYFAKGWESTNSTWRIIIPTEPDAPESPSSVQVSFSLRIGEGTLNASIAVPAGKTTLTELLPILQDFDSGLIDRVIVEA